MPLMKTPEQGADTVLYLATSPDVAGVTGNYFDNRKGRQTAKISYNETVARQLWEVSAQLTKLT
jgi:retinol dehydrogenase-14